MKSYKNKVKNNFDSASDSYDAVSIIQCRSAQILAQKLYDAVPTFMPKTILDVGCGTGHMTAQLIAQYPLSNYGLNDISKNMLKKAQERLEKNVRVHTINADMEKFPFPPYDLIVSNFVLQWAEDLQRTLKKLYEASNVLAFTCLLKGTFDEFFIRLPDNSDNKKEGILKYPTEEEVKKFLETLPAKNYFIWHENFPIYFKNIRDFFYYIKNLGARVNHNQFSYSVLKSLLQEKGEFITYYRVLFVIIIK